MTEQQYIELYNLVFLGVGFLRVLIVTLFFIAGHFGYLIYIKGSEK